MTDESQFFAFLEGGGSRTHLFPAERSKLHPFAMALLEALELSLEPRGWSMQRGHRKRLTTLRGDDRCIHRSTVKRSVASGRRVQVEEKNKSHKWPGKIRKNHEKSESKPK